MYGNINPQTPCTGRPPKLNDSDKRNLAQLSDAHPHATTEELLHEFRLGVGASTRPLPAQPTTAGFSSSTQAMDRTSQ